MLIGGCIQASPGNLYLWGENNTYNTNTPTAQTPANGGAAQAPTGITGVAMENLFSMALVKGTLYTAPGPNTYCDDGVGRPDRVFAWTPILANVVQMSGGNGFGVALRADGTVWVWGNEENSWTLGTGQANQQCSPEQVPGLSDIVSVAAGGQHTLAIAADGTVYGWGTNEDGDLALPSSVKGEDTPTPIMNAPAGSRVTAGHLISAVWVPGGSGWAFGQNSYGQLGIGSFSTAVYTPTPIAGQQQIGQLSMGGDLNSDGHMLLLTTTGGVYATGDNASGQLCNGTTTNSPSFTAVPNPPSGISVVSAGGQHSMFFSPSDGEVYACGFNGSGQIGNGSSTNVLTPLLVMTGVSYMSAGAEASMASS